MTGHRQPGAPSLPGNAPATFQFEIRAARKLLLVTKSGYWDMATFDRFAAAFRDHLRRMRADRGCDHCLIDASAFAVQSSEITAALQMLVESFDPACPRRMAGIISSQLSKLQARRSGDNLRRQVFSTRAEAEAWLFAPEA